MQPNYTINSDYHKPQTDYTNFYSEVFIVKCNIDLSFFAQKILDKCCNKKFYQVLESIEYGLKFNVQEQNYLLQIFRSIAISLQNNTNVQFFDIHIYDININKLSQFNKLNCQLSESTYIRIQCFCSTKPPKKKKEPAW